MKTVIAFVLMAACSAYGQFQITEVNVDEVRKNYIEHNGFYIYKVDTRWVFDYRVKNREVKKKLSSTCAETGHSDNRLQPTSRNQNGGVLHRQPTDDKVYVRSRPNVRYTQSGVTVSNGERRYTHVQYRSFCRHPSFSIPLNTHF